MADSILSGSGIYAIVNKVNGKRYIGSACALKSRLRTHKSRLNLNKHHSQKLQNSWNKNGESCFTFEVIEYVADKSLLIDREQFWIDYYLAATPYGYNVAPKAGNCLGVKHSAETKAKVSAAGIGRKMPRDSVERGAAARTGRKNSAESIARMTGKPFTDERKANISKGKLGKKHSPEANARKSAVSIGRRHTQETIEKLRLIRKGRKNTPEGIEKRRLTMLAKKIAKQNLLFV